MRNANERNAKKKNEMNEQQFVCCAFRCNFFVFGILFCLCSFGAMRENDDMLTCKSFYTPSSSKCKKKNSFTKAFDHFLSFGCYLRNT